MRQLCQNITRPQKFKCDNNIGARCFGIDTELDGLVTTGFVEEFVEEFDFQISI